MNLDLLNITKEEIFKIFEEKNISKMPEYAYEQTANWQTENYIKLKKLRTFVQEWVKTMRLHWNEDREGLVCERCGRDVSSMKIEMATTMFVDFYDLYKDEGIIEYKPGEPHVNKEVLVCRCGAEMSVDIYGGEGDEPKLKFERQHDGSYLAC